MILTPLAVYQNALASGNYEADPAQANAMRALEHLFVDINAEYKKRFLPDILIKKTPPRGVYLYGEVGAGKTWMMDMFFGALKVPKARFHFHQFMREVHRKLKVLQGHVDPLKKIAKDFAKQAKIICFDELFVNDIGDAMILGELFQVMFSEGIFFVMTSNVPPDQLYRNGLQRSRFLPAIQLLNQNMRLVQVKSLKDYRWRVALERGVYFSPLSTDTAEKFQQLFSQLTLHELVMHEPVLVNARDIACVGRAKEVLWCRFDQLCAIPRSVQDYVALSQQFKVFLLDEIPIIPNDADNAIWYLISLVDVLYDARCRLALRSSAKVSELYHGEKLRFEFQRTLSRLQEMQTETYWN